MGSALVDIGHAVVNDYASLGEVGVGPVMEAAGS
jgi:hypothetical protein